MTGVRKHAEKFGCGKTQVINILNQKTLVREEYERGFSSAKKRNRTSQYSDVNDAVWERFKKKTEQRTPVDGSIILLLNQQKAWMTSDILHKLLSQLNSSFKAQNRSILLFIDSA